MHLYAYVYASTKSFARNLLQHPPPPTTDHLDLMGRLYCVFICVLFFCGHCVFLCVWLCVCECVSVHMFEYGYVHVCAYVYLYVHASHPCFRPSLRPHGTVPPSPGRRAEQNPATRPPARGADRHLALVLGRRAAGPAPVRAVRESVCACVSECVCVRACVCVCV